MLGWLFGRKVLLQNYRGELRMFTARKRDAGWAVWLFSENEWYVLRPDGKVIGHPIIERWLPHSGWTEEEIALCTKARGD